MSPGNLSGYSSISKVLGCCRFCCQESVPVLIFLKSTSISPRTKAGLSSDRSCWFAEAVVVISQGTNSSTRVWHLAIEHTTVAYVRILSSSGGIWICCCSIAKCQTLVPLEALSRLLCACTLAAAMISHSTNSGISKLLSRLLCACAPTLRRLHISACFSLLVIMP